MASLQRRRGSEAKIWRTEIVTDRRGNRVVQAVPATPHLVRCALIPERSSKAEVPGQQGIAVMQMIVDADLEGVNLWSRVEVIGEVWDVVSPPIFHKGTRHTRHWTISIRKRPSGAEAVSDGG